MVHPTDRRDPPNCVAIGNAIEDRTNMANGVNELPRVFGPSLPMSPDESNLLQKFREQAQKTNKSEHCADLSATAVIDVSRMKMLANRACQGASQGLINQVGPALVERGKAWKPKVDAACKND